MDGSNGIREPLLDDENPEDYISKDKAINESSSSSSHYSENSPDKVKEEDIEGENVKDRYVPMQEDATNHIAISKELFDN